MKPNYRMLAAGEKIQPGDEILLEIAWWCGSGWNVLTGGIFIGAEVGKLHYGLAVPEGAFRRQVPQDKVS